MYPGKDRLTVGDVAQGQGDMLLASGLVFEAMHGEGGPGGGQPGGGDESNGHGVPR